MGIEADAQVSGIKAVEDRNGDRRPAANADLQEQVVSLLELIEQSDQTDSYAYGSAFNLSGGQSANPGKTIREVHVTGIGADSLTLTINTTGGSSINYPHNGGSLVISTLRVDSIEVSDPNGTGAAIEGVWVGE